MSRSPAFALLSLLSLGLSACADEEAPPELTTFADCDALDRWLDTSAMTEATWGYDAFGSGPGVLRGDALEAPQAANVGAPAATSGGASTYSTTNVQVDGVDEADVVKNDGQNLYVLDGAGLDILTIWPATQTHSLSYTAIEGTPSSLYFDGDQTVVVFSRLSGRAQPASGGSFSVGDASWDTSTKITVLDVSDRAAPVVQREIYVEGELRSSRRIGDRIHVVLTDSLNDRWEPEGSYDNYLYARRQKLQTLGATEWIPNLSDHQRSGGGWTVAQGDVTRCTDVYRPANRTDLQFTTVLSFSPADPNGELQTAGVIARADTVYASRDALYFGMSEYETGPFPNLDGSLDSRLHKFLLTPDGPVYTASGRVPGSLLNQFSMDEQDGFLRLATSDSGDPGSANSLFVLEQDGTRLSVVGSVTGLVPDESIYAVRFVGDRGYMVTFRQVDPLFTFDLSDPTDPRLVGQLDVTGFSNYLHPLGADRLLAVGEEASPEGSVQGLQVSLFDVSDFANPQLQDRVLIPGMGSSEAQYDHHAFTFYEPRGVLAVPVQRWGTGDQQDSSLALFSVDPSAEDPLVALDEVDHSAWLRATGGDSLAEEAQWCGQARRSVFAGGFLYVVSSFGVQLVHLDSGRTLGGVLLPTPQCFWSQGFWF